MQAIIMAAGKGSRLGELTKDRPKSFVEIKGKKLIDYNLDMLIQYGIKDIIIVTGHMSEFFEDNYANHPNIRLVYNPFYEMTNVLGSYWCGQKFLTEDFIFIHADSLCDHGIFEDLLEARGDVVLPVDFGPCDEEAMKVKVADSKVKDINKTMNPNEADGEFIGIAKISTATVPVLEGICRETLKDGNFLAFFEAALQAIVDKSLAEVKTIPTEGRFWCEIDFAQDYEKAARDISDSLTR